ncbi:heme lyase CcmF/NrfE family subunit [Cellvibrio polysaccharolyticus]|uniref:Heme lyase CcmF/NrfE family subunit n=1 Tax=Cellvibrio polysaccharolyticus TaxID=2082724 RepID=A0A928YVU8_9GAMM|nr:heme lyase CcmF/NrfE family subunit [Cellvibrio polysaccharolyticus]MBE8717478.1 heme lyase CcmF/NrfE family subunit [Cellvibrio polysaccharolyticus]
MIPEWGNFALILALGLAFALTIIPLVGASTGNALLMHSARSLATGFFTMVLVSFIFLTTAFVQDDFSVAYVASNSNSLLPVYYKISAVWGGHEGSLLLWVLMLAGWTFAIARFSKSLPLDMQARVLAVMGFVAVGFLLFMLLTSNPFDRILPLSPQEGSDLNPMLQDIGLIIHPPVLYMGYVGFSATFAFALAALMSGRMDSAWARWSRPWANLAWAFLTVGIALGSWWAYYELGWGGWWFWDPVENASFMPWLVGTALIHSLAVTEKRGIFKSWTILLAIFTFSLSLLGTFLVRSGVLTSVHAFASDPERGVFILFFLLVVVGGSLILYALRAPVVKSSPGFTWLSRESFLLMNNMLLIIMMLTVLAGTLYPLIKSALNMGLISVGPPYFNITFLPLMALLCLLMALGPLVNWKNNASEKLIKMLYVPGGISLVGGIAFPFLYGGEWSWQAALTVFIALWITTALVLDIRNKIRHADTVKRGLGRLTLSYYGMVLAHLGIVVSLTGVCLTSIYNDLRDVRMDIDKPVQVAEFEFVLEGVFRVPGPNYVADEAVIRVSKHGDFVREMKPQKRRYLSNGQVMTEVALDAGLFRDLYIAMGEPLNNGAWAMRVHFKPFVRWIWLGALMMAFGAGLAVADKRYRKKNGDPALAAEAQAS